MPKFAALRSGRDSGRNSVRTRLRRARPLPPARSRAAARACGPGRGAGAEARRAAERDTRAAAKCSGRSLPFVLALSPRPSPTSRPSDHDRDVLPARDFVGDRRGDDAGLRLGRPQLCAVVGVERHELARCPCPETRDRRPSTSAPPFAGPSRSARQTSRCATGSHAISRPRSAAHRRLRRRLRTAGSAALRTARRMPVLYARPDGVKQGSSLKMKFCMWIGM